MFQLLRLVLVALTVGLYATPSSAQLFKLNVVNYGGCNASSTAECLAFKSLVDSEIAVVEADINKGLPGGSPDRFMKGMANSSVMAGKGIGSDYSSYMDVFLIGAGVGVGADMEKSKDPDSDLSGIGIAPGLVVGLNLGVLPVNKIFGLEANRLSVYANFMSFSKDQEFDKSSAGIDMTAIGTHVRYDWIRPKGNKFFGWGGVKLHTGYEYNKTDLNFKTTINETISQTSNAGNPTETTISGDLDAAPEATINVATHSIPLEISTDVRFLYVFSLYSGLGMDFNFGEAKGGGSLNASPSQISCDGGTGCNTAGNPDATVQAKANIDSTGKVNSMLYRGFVGVQFNIPLVRVFVQADKAFGNDLIGATAGLRIAY